MVVGGVESGSLRIMHFLRQENNCIFGHGQHHKWVEFSWSSWHKKCYTPKNLEHYSVQFKVRK